MFSHDLKRLHFRCQTLKFFCPHVKFPQQSLLCNSPWYIKYFIHFSEEVLDTFLALRISERADSELNWVNHKKIDCWRNFTFGWENLKVWHLKHGRLTHSQVDVIYGNTPVDHLKGLVEDYAKWKIDLFWCVFKSAWILACSLQITRNTLGCIFFTVLRFVFEKKRMQKNQVFAAACFWDLLLNEKQKKSFVCLNNESSEALHMS